MAVVTMGVHKHHTKFATPDRGGSRVLDTALSPPNEEE